MWPYPWTHVGTPLHLGHMDRVAATMPSQAHAGAAQEAPDIGQWEEQDVPLVRPSSCNVKGGIPSSRRYLPTYLPLYMFQWTLKDECPLYVFSPYLGVGAGGLPRGLGHNLLMQFFSLSTSKMVLPVHSSRCLAGGNRMLGPD